MGQRGSVLFATSLRTFTLARQQEWLNRAATPRYLQSITVCLNAFTTGNLFFSTNLFEVSIERRFGALKGLIQVQKTAPTIQLNRCFHVYIGGFSITDQNNGDEIYSATTTATTIIAVLSINHRRIINREPSEFQSLLSTSNCYPNPYPIKPSQPLCLTHLLSKKWHALLKKAGAVLKASLPLQNRSHTTVVYSSPPSQQRGCK